VRALLPWIVLLSAWAPQAAPPPPPDSPALATLQPPTADVPQDLSAAEVLDNCSRVKLPPTAGSDGLWRICPDLERAITDLGLDDHLDYDWREHISSAAVMDLARLTRRYQSAPPSMAPAVGTLAQVVLSLHPPSAPRSWWQQFKAWLRAWFSQPERRDTGWLRDVMLRLQLPQALTQVLWYLIMAGIVGLALWIVLRELKAAGVLSPRVAAGTGGARRAPEQAHVALTSSPELESLPPWQRPAALLAALVQVLRHSGRLGLERALTHRELGQRGAFDDAAQRARFLRVALLAERQLYGVHASGPGVPADSHSAQVLADGAALYAQLLASPAVPR
jgi:hypothetical protein